MADNCFCHFNGYEVKDATARKNIETLNGDVDKKIASLRGVVDGNATTLSQEIAVERNRIDNIASLGEGSTTGDAELADIRIGQSGKAYDSAGAAVRGEDALRPAYYGSVNYEDYGGLSSNLIEPGFYGLGSGWTDLPAAASFELCVFRYTTGYVVQHAYDIRSSASFTRVIKISDKSVYRDWISDTEHCVQYKAVPTDAKTAQLVSMIVQPGIYGIGSSGFTDVPYGSYILRVYPYTDNWVSQVLTEVYTGTMYTRVVNKTSYAILRNWAGVGGHDPVYVLCVGDSIAKGARNAGLGFVGDLRLPYKNDAVSGARLSNTGAYGDIATQLINEAEYTPDVIIANGGINDYYGNVPLGEIPVKPATNDNQANLLDRTTVIGGLEYLFYNMIKLHYKAQRFFLVIHKVTKDGVDATITPNSAGYTQKELTDAIKKVCEVYSVNVIDVYNESLINTAFPQYVSPVSYETDETVTNREYVDSDGLHPLAYGYKHGYIPIVKKALQIGTTK